MGEYWKPVNLTRREYIHPHHVDCGLKLGEWWEWNGEPVDSPVRRIIESRWRGDDVVAVSDYGGQLVLSGSPSSFPDYDTLGDKFTEVSDEAQDTATSTD